MRRDALGEDVILVRSFTSAEDVAGFNAARGILTAQGGKSSHAAIVARGMGRPCVCGAGNLSIDSESGSVQIGGLLLREGDLIAIDGSTGQVTADEVRLVPPEPDPYLEEVLDWADGFRTLGVRANADSGPDATRARELGAEGIGLCRTEHMFFGADRDRIVRETFIVGELARREQMAEGGTGRYLSEFERGLAELGRLQRDDFREIFAAMEGRPVTIRLLDPPLHEFIPTQVFEGELALAKERGDRQEVAHAERNRRIARELEEVNPMLGTRGVRLALLLPGLYEMQTRAIVEAALEAGSEGCPPRVEIMVPLVTWESELDFVVGEIRRTAESVIEAAGGDLDFSIGTMVELPRTCEVADLVAGRVDFFSFGTNDLTQTALGLSRDDAERTFLPDYLNRGLITRNPFETIDVPGVGRLIDTAVRKGREVNGDLALGVCGEHGGDPDSITFFHHTGIDYVSCSPFRVPVARVAAALAAIEAGAEDSSPD